MDRFSLLTWQSLSFPFLHVHLPVKVAHSHMSDPCSRVRHSLVSSKGNRTHVLKDPRPTWLVLKLNVSFKRMLCHCEFSGLSLHGAWDSVMAQSEAWIMAPLPRVLQDIQTMMTPEGASALESRYSQSGGWDHALPYMTLSHVSLMGIALKSCQDMTGIYRKKEIKKDSFACWFPVYFHLFLLLSYSSLFFFK